MLNIGLKKDRCNYLNNLLNNYEQMKIICAYGANDRAKVVQIISKIIKYVVLNYRNDETIGSLQHMLANISDIDVAYAQVYQDKRPPRFFKKANTSLPYELDADIRPLDLIGLNLPSFSFIEKICEDNKRVTNLLNERTEKREKTLSTLMGFDIAAFTYQIEEVVLLDENFAYAGDNLTGDVNDDFHALYCDERYQDNSILNNDYQANLQSILDARDISLVKKGGLYYIENGRHRLLYLLAREQTVAIKANVTKRIENEEFNRILIDLHNVIDFIVLKDNPYQDDERICIIHNGNLYVINNITDLQSFAEYYPHYPSLMPFVKQKIDSSIIRQFITDITNYCLYNNINILELSFTDLVLAMKIEATNNFYEAYMITCSIKNNVLTKEKLKELDKEALKR